MPLPLIGLGLGLIGGIGKLFGRGRANRELDKVLAQDPTYKENPLARQQLGLAQTLFNARMPGASSIERNIYSTQANQLANINRLATDSSQALALAAGTQGQTNNAFNNLGIQEAQDYQRRYGNLEGAEEGVIREGDKVYSDQVRRFGDLSQIRGAQNANRQNNWGDIANLGFGLMDFGLGGGLDSILGKNRKGQGGMNSDYSQYYYDPRMRGY